jgi:hypothetical protein
MNKEDMLWGLCQENLQYCRHHEVQRETVTKLGVAAASALISFIVLDKNLNLWDLPIAFLVVLIGVFSSVLSYKHYERFSHHYARFQVLRAELAQHFEVDISTLNKIGDNNNERAFPRLSKLSLGRIWLTIHLIVTAVGFILALAALLCTRFGPCAVAPCA